MNRLMIESFLPINQQWLSDYSLLGQGFLLIHVLKPPPTDFDNLRKHPNKLVDKLYWLKPGRDTAIIRELIVHRRILLRQGSTTATDDLPSVIEEAAPQPKCRSRDIDSGFCVFCDQPSSASSRWCAGDRASYHFDCYDDETYRLYNDTVDFSQSYKRLLTIGTMGVTTYNKDTLRVTNQWPYSEICGVRPDPTVKNNQPHLQRLILTLCDANRKRTEMTFASEYRVDVLTDFLDGSTTSHMVIDNHLDDTEGGAVARCNSKDLTDDTKTSHWPAGGLQQVTLHVRLFPRVRMIGAKRFLRAVPHSTRCKPPVALQTRTDLATVDRQIRFRC
ncbi:hypothetical protein T265_08965 [Opisthorchis viverrini]|uniref:DnaJ homologue subfamily C GRV2/DNAJC13 N-terminal domain-containing protein n=1 Tax=Opisthorchis viverrini TaxID=6198 RepID=A0A074Z7A3_OPIVI|nr:hypothetical protein T265_08965 [Opisthorchis viverrini]KER23066.1 hypothetical protein T265_08965 [Opisthorchis viverrini]